MNNEQFIRFVEGRIILPVGYRFDPTDEDLVGCYLKKKAFGEHEPTPIIQEFDLFQTEPWNLPGDRNLFKGRKFFFLNMREKHFDNIDIRAAGNGEWRCIEKEKAVPLPDPNFVGKKNTFAFWEKQDNLFVETRWIMHEFRFTKVYPPKISVWNAYRVYQKKKKGKGKRKSYGSAKLPTIIDVTMEDANGSVPPPPTTP